MDDRPPIRRTRDGDPGVLDAPSWRWIDLDLPDNFESGYIASWKDRVKWVTGSPPIVPSWMPHWMLALPDPDRAERLQRRVPRVLLVVGSFAFVVGVVNFTAGAPGAWFSIASGSILIVQGWMAGHGRESWRFVARRIAPALWFLFLVRSLAEARLSTSLTAIQGEVGSTPSSRLSACCLSCSVLRQRRSRLIRRATREREASRAG